MSAATRKPNALLAAISRAVPVEDQPSPDRVARPRAPSERQTPAASQRPSRVGTKLVAGHFDPRIARQLRMIAAEEDTTVQALLEEALDLLFVKKGKARLDDIARA